MESGGARRDRTDDLMLAKHALSQLSYVPVKEQSPERTAAPQAFEVIPTLVGLGRLERPTSPLSGVRSNHLSYRPSTIEQGSPDRAEAPVGPHRRSRYLVRKRNEGGICPANGL